MFKIEIKNLFNILAISACIGATSLSQAVDELIVEVDINRSELELNDRIAQIPLVANTFDTAVLLTSYDKADRKVHCTAFNASGEKVGRAKVAVPSHGVKLLFASDLSQGRDFLGKISCKTRGQINGSAYLLGPAFSDLQVKNSTDRAGSFIRIPVALSR